MMWVIIANTNECRIFQYEKKSKELTLVKDLAHPESKLKGIDLTSSAPGHYHTSGGSHGAYSPHEEPREVEFEYFAREIANELDIGRKGNHYENFILMALPHMNGLIQKHLTEHVKEKMMDNIKKDYIHLTEDEILETLKNELRHG